MNPEIREVPPRFRLVHSPTPIVHLPRLTAALGGPEIHMKRDDLTGAALGGNKLRKLEFLIGDARRSGADIVVTAGGAQSNHAAQTAAAAAAAGLACVLVLKTEDGAIPLTEGNLLLGKIHGARTCWTDDDAPFEHALAAAADELRQSGRRPYIIPFGGSNSLGALGYVEAMAEYRRQVSADRAPQVDHHIIATGSGGTQAGLLAGMVAEPSNADIIGISVLFRSDVLTGRIHSILEGVLDGPNLERARCALQICDEFLGGGYGVIAEPEAEAIQLVARTEGILLDPVYTGRAMAGLIALIREQRFPPHERVLFWHTGGQAALFGKRQSLLRHIS